MSRFHPVDPACIALGLFALLSGILALAPASATTPLTDYHREVFSTRDGLPHNSINAITQTPEGYLWFATWEGLARFNGRRFRIFERGSETGLPDSGLRHLGKTHRGHLLVAGARGGVSLFDGHDWQALPPAPAMVNYAHVVKDDRLWLATSGAGLIDRQRVAEGAEWQDVTYLPGSSVNVVISHGENIWIGTSAGLNQLDPVTGTLSNPLGDLSPGPVFCLATDQRNRLLVGTEQGLFVLTTNGLELVSGELGGMVISALLVEPSGEIWLGTVNRGLMRWSDLGLEVLDTTTGLPNNRVLALHRDNEDSLWVGTNGGLLRLRQAPFVTATREDGLAGDYVRAVLPTPQGLVVATSEGVSRQQGERFIELTDRGAPLGLSTLSLARNNDSLLLGTHTDGLLIWQDGQIVERIDRQRGLPSNEVRAIAVDGERIWAGTAEGLARIEEGEISVFGVADGLAGDYLMALRIDQYRRLWIGTGTGLTLLDRGVLNDIPIDQHDQAQYAFGITPDPDPRYMWVSTDRGLIRVDIDSLETTLIGRSSGFPIDKLFQVIPDQAENLWLTSNRGVIRISRMDAHAVASGQQQTLDFEIYGEGDGMLSAQANGGSNPASAWYDNRVWIATARGLASVDPNRLTHYAETAIPVVIESLQTDLETLPLNQPPVVPAGTNRVVIQYAGLGFVMPQRIRYRTLLEPFDDQWIERDQQIIAEYTNLPPGKYRFQVEASYPQGEWSGEPASLSFEIKPLFWQRRISWLIAALLIAGTIALTIRLRLRRLRMQALNLRQQVDQKTDALKRQAEDFAHQARVDQLTGLANRRAFDEWLAREFRTTVERGHILSLVVMDIDHFKQVNDHWTHIAGDQVICKIAEVLKRHTRSADQAARWGGEEFTLTFSGTTARDAAVICERIRLAIASLDLGDITKDSPVTASFGVCDSSSADNYEDLLRHADQALYKAKQTGRNRVVIHTDV